MTRDHPLLTAAAALCLAHAAFAQGPLTTAFTYQGELRQSGNPVTGVYDVRFRLYDAPTGGTQLGSAICSDNLSLAAGRFTVQLDFGSQFAGQQRYLEAEARPDTGLDCSNSAGFALLSPRQALSAAPNSMFALTAATATSSANATQLNGQAASFYQNAANLNAGTIPSARLSGTYSSPLVLSAVANSFTGVGTGLTSLNATSLASGTVADARLSTNIPRLNTANAFGNVTNSFLGNVGIGTASPGMKLTVAGDMELGTNSGDYRRFRIGGGNSDGFLFGSYPAFGDGIHMGYNYYADAAGTGHLVHPDGATSRIQTGYGFIGLFTGGVGQGPLKRLTFDYDAINLWGQGQYLTGQLLADPYPSSTWPSGTYPLGTPFNSAGAIFLRGAAGNNRWGVRSRYNVGSSVFPNQGEMFMDDATGTRRLRCYMSGEGGAQGSSGNVECTNLFVSGSKSFITPHPEHADKDIVYYCMEGPENGIYLRGTSHLVAGRAHVDLPDTFSSIASKEGLTVIVTPQSLDSRGLACVNRSVDGFDVGELMQGSGEYDFDWEVKAVRRGMRDRPVVVPWTEHAMGDGSLDELWQKRLLDVERQNATYAEEDRALGGRP
jgi:hypothetical protein